MVELIVFYLHVVAVATMFTKRWQEEGLAEGSLVVFFMGLIFFVGWSIATFLLKLIMEERGLGIFFDRNAASLLLLTIGEGVLYYFYLRDDNNPEQTDEKDSPVAGSESGMDE
jgi:hypothetical protein